MKTVVIFLRNISKTEKPFNDPYYWHSYQDLALIIQAKGAQAYFAAGNATYLGNGKFSTAYAITKKVPVTQFTPVQNITADVIFDKGDFAATDIPVINPPFVRDITASKLHTYEHFARYQPHTIICRSKPELATALAALKGELVVVKETEGNGGDFVYIGNRNQVMTRAANATYPLIAQEFIDTSGGVPGMIEGIHDLRIMIGGGVIWSGKFRWPKEGEYRANVAQGGSEQYLSVEAIPLEARRLALEIDAYFAKYDRYIAIDLALTADGWKLIELNSKPGLTPASFSPISKHTLTCLADYLIGISVESAV